MSARGLSRRGFLAALGTGAGGAAVLAACDTSDDAQASGSAQLVSPHGAHQAGITTAQQNQMAFAAFDLVTTSRDDIAALLATWTAAIEAMTAGREVADDAASPLLPPKDTGETAGSAPARLTVTVGFGPGLFDDRFGLASRKPAALEQIPAMPGDALEEARSGGDLCVQACADDPQVAFHAMRNLRRLAQGTAALRWTQLGFGKGAATSTAQTTPRNLMGFKDGTNNLKLEDAGDIARYVFAGSESDQSWMHGGSYVVARRIAMRIESWDRDALSDQEKVFGRTKTSGAPLGAKQEHDALPLRAKTASGELVIPAKAHIRLAHSDTIKILRRGYNYTDGTDPATGELEAGLFFIAYQKDPRTQFVPLQRNLAAHDALNEYIVHTSSAVFACPPGFAAGGRLGEGLI